MEKYWKRKCLVKKPQKPTNLEYILDKIIIKKCFKQFGLHNNIFFLEMNIQCNNVKQLGPRLIGFGFKPNHCHGIYMEIPNINTLLLIVQWDRQRLMGLVAKKLKAIICINFIFLACRMHVSCDSRNNLKGCRSTYLTVAAIAYVGCTNR